MSTTTAVSPAVNLSPAAIEAELRELAAEAMDSASKARAPRTLDAYAADWSTFSGWCEARRLDPLPASAATVALFVQHQARTLKPSTINRRLSAINAVHADAGHGKPGSDPQVRLVLKGITRAHARASADTGTRRVAKADALLRDDLLVILPPLQSDRLVDIRDRALLLVGFAGFFRRSELASITVENLEPLGGDCVRVRLPITKTGQVEGGSRDICRGSSATADPIAAIDRWQTAAGITDGHLFRSVDRHGNIGAGLSDRSVDRVIRERAEQANLAGSYSGHSLRRGAATHARLAGFSQLDISRAGGWADNSRVVAGYVADGQSTGLALL